MMLGSAPVGLDAKDAPILLQMRELAAQYPSDGYRRIRIFLRCGGIELTADRTYRLWRTAKSVGVVQLDVRGQRENPAAGATPQVADLELDADDESRQPVYQTPSSASLREHVSDSCPGADSAGSALAADADEVAAAIAEPKMAGGVVVELPRRFQSDSEIPRRVRPATTCGDHGR